MVRNPDHALLSPPTHDERLRQQFVFTLKRHIGSKIRPGNRTIYEKVAKPAFEKAEGHAPETTTEIGSVMWQQPSYQMFSALNRAAQEQMWESVADPIYRNRERLSETYGKLHNRKDRKGSLELDPNFQVPRGIASVDIHLQPGGYAIDYGDNDVLAGAFYEGGGNLYSMSGGIGTTESKAEVIMRFLKEHYPGFTPTKILDFACSAGSSSTPWALAFPIAEVHAIDVGAAMLRYAHGRAEALDAAVHFHQMDAGKTTFPDESFDFVVSHNAMHEMSQKTSENMFKESFRLLKPGGISVHQDVPLRFSELDTFTEFDYSWDQQNNNEPYWSVYASNDPRQMFIDAGFPEDNVWLGKFQQLDKTVSWFVSAAQKPGG
jgi:ubiquinone/menaquinone biosynthesis C-methylase UbiE